MLSAPIAEYLSDRQVYGITATMPDCQMLLHTTTLKPKNREECELFRDEIVNIVHEFHVSIVILANRWASIVSPIRSPNDGELRRELFDSENGGRPIEFGAALNTNSRADRGGWRSCSYCRLRSRDQFRRTLGDDTASAVRYRSAGLRPLDV